MISTLILMVFKRAIMQEKVYTELYQENTKAGERAKTKSKAKPYRLC